MPKAYDTFYYRNKETGLLELIDCLTGQILARERAPGEAMEEIRSAPGKFLYNEVTAHELCNLVADGHPLTELCKRPDMPDYGIVRQWRIRVPVFAAMLEQAYKDRGETHRDEMYLKSKQEYAKDDAPRKRNEIEVLKYLIQADNPERYSITQKIDKQVTSTKIVIETGIRRTDDQHFHKDEAKNVTPNAEFGTQHGGRLTAEQHERSD